MKTRLAVRILVSLTVAAAAIALVALRLDARDVYKGFLDPGIPHHRAILDTLALLDRSPNDATLHNDLGCLIARDGFWRDALREFSTAAKLDPKDSRPFFNAGLVRAWKSEWSGARASFKKAVKRVPGNWPAWWMLGYCEEQLGNVDSAVDAYKVSLRVDTSLFDVKHNPFAADTKLKSRVLLETLDKRRLRAAMPLTEQLADADRVGAFFQRARPAPATAATQHEDAAPDTHSQGPVVTTLPPSGPARPSSVTPVPARQGPPRGRAPATISEPPREIPVPDGLEPQTAPPGTTSAPPKTAPGPGGGV